MNADVKLKRMNGEYRGVAGMAVLRSWQPWLSEPLAVEVVVVAPDADHLADAIRMLRTNPDPAKNQVVRIRKADA